MLIDTHCHLDAPEFQHMHPALLAAAAQSGIRALVVPGALAAHFETIQKLCAQYPHCAPAWGIHPLYVETATENDLEQLQNRLEQTAHSGAVAIGEIGIDLYERADNLERQRFFFIEQVKLAKAYQLPIIVHARKAIDPVLQVLRQIKVPGGIIHAFNGSEQQATQCIELGFKLGYGGAMTFSGSTRIRKLAATLPLSALVLESDAPDIPPAWAPNQINVPANIAQFAQILAELRQISLGEVIQQTGHNALQALPKLRTYL